MHAAAVSSMLPAIWGPASQGVRKIICVHVALQNSAWASAWASVFIVHMYHQLQGHTPEVYRSTAVTDVKLL